MKKAKLMLSVIAVFAIVGGTVAVKANKAKRVGDVIYTAPGAGIRATFTVLDVTIGAGGVLTNATTKYYDFAQPALTIAGN